MSTEHAHPRCQSCSMPLTANGQRGTNTDGTMSDDYCLHCFAGGTFTRPQITMEEMMAHFAQLLGREQNLSEDQAQVLAHGTIPTLKRWKHHGNEGKGTRN